MYACTHYRDTIFSVSQSNIMHICMNIYMYIYIYKKIYIYTYGNNKYINATI